MKSVHYCCDSSELGGIVNAVSLAMRQLEFCPQENVKVFKQTRVYYDNSNFKQLFSRSFLCYGGMLRQSIDHKSGSVLIEHKRCASEETHWFAADRPVNAEEISRKINYRGKLIPVLNVECEAFSQTWHNSNLAAVEISFQDVKSRDGKTICFVSLRDKTKPLFGKNYSDEQEKIIAKCFKAFKTEINKFNVEQVYNKYKVLVHEILDKETEKEPF